MEKRSVLAPSLELLWWLITAVIVWVVLSPIYKAMYVWPFRNTNIAFVVALVTFTRYIFLLKYTFLAHRQELKVVVLLLMFPVTFMLMDHLNGFIRYIDDNTWEVLTGHLPPGDKEATESYLWNEMLFFGVGSVIAAPVLAGRMFMSVWRTRNRGTV